MASIKQFRRVKLSLADLLGGDFAEAAAAARCALTGEESAKLRRLIREKVDFFPADFQRSLAAMLPKVGSRVVQPPAVSPRGAATFTFDAAAQLDAAPLSALGCYRVGEDGILRLVSKSEHYHAPLGHGFPGYRLIEHARRVGIPNATHNNTRGCITRMLEEELVRTANGLARDDRAGLDRVLSARRKRVLNRVLNLETGSLAVEAGIKMMLARFYRIQPDSPEPRYAGRTPVILVLADDERGLQANYHGTTIVAQVLRGMWPALGSELDRRGLLRVVGVRPDNTEELEAAFRTHDAGPSKIAGFLHEIVLMNYGGRLVSRRFLKRAYELCRKHDVPTLVDEIQTCLWNPRLYMFREYGLKPSFVVIGKGFPGGEYAASRILFCREMDTLPQFGALVTNGQEELASLAYMITMRWAEENSDITSAIGDRYQARLHELVGKYPNHLAAVEGNRHMASLHFHDLAAAKAFVKMLSGAGLDVSVQSYKASCPPGALTKLPLIADCEAVDMVIDLMEKALAQL